MNGKNIINNNTITMVPRRRGRTEQLPGVGDRWHCRRQAAAAVPSVSLWSVCHRCRGARAISIIIYFFLVSIPVRFYSPASRDQFTSVDRPVLSVDRVVIAVAICRSCTKSFFVFLDR